MEDDTNNSEESKIFCCKLPPRKQWIWLYTTVPSTLICFIHSSSVVLDTIVAYRLVWTEHMPFTGLTVFILIYVPVVFTMFLKLPSPPSDHNCSSFVGCALKTLLYATSAPLLTSLRLLDQVVWTVTVIYNKKPHEEITHEYSTLLPKEIHSYIFLQAFLHCCPQAILQAHLLLLQVCSDKYTVYFQVLSLLVAVTSVAMRAASFHRYEAQVAGGRPAMLLLNAPEATMPDSSTTLLPIRSCITTEVISLGMDSLPGKVFLFFSWFFLIHSRILCLVIGYEIYPIVTLVFLIFHIVLFLLYFIASNPTTFYNILSKVLNSVISVFVLVEVSLTFHKVTLLYILFFISVVAEDTILTVLFFIYSSNICSSGVLNCDHFGLYSYLIINSHVVGVMLFTIYLSSFQPASHTVSETSFSSSSEPRGGTL